MGRDPPGCLGWVGEPSQRTGTGRETLGEVRDGSRVPREVRDELGDPWGGPGRVRGPSQRSLTGRGTLGEVWDKSGDLWGG